LIVGEFKEIEEEGEKKMLYSTKETDFLQMRNTSRVIKILANPNDYFYNDLILDRKSLHGVPTDLREKLAKLASQKFEEELRKRGYHIPGDEQERPKTPPLSKDSSGSSTPTGVPTPKETPETKNDNKDKDTISALQQKIAELEQKIKELETGKDNSQRKEEIRNEILNSELSEEQK